MLGDRPQLRFWLTVLALLPACFLIWHYLATIIAIPAVLVAEPLLTVLAPGLVESAKLQGSDLLVVTTLGESGGKLMSAELAGNQIAFPVNTRVLSYSFPFFCGLYFSTRRDKSGSALIGCFCLLWVLLAIGLTSTALKDLMLGLGSNFNEAAVLLPNEAIALLYQFSTLMVPPLAPVILWAYVSRDSADFRALLPAAFNPAQDSE